MMEIGDRVEGLRVTRTALGKMDREAFEVGGLTAFASMAKRTDVPLQILEEV